MRKSAVSHFTLFYATLATLTNGTCRVLFAYMANSDANINQGDVHEDGQPDQYLLEHSYQSVAQDGHREAKRHVQFFARRKPLGVRISSSQYSFGLAGSEHVNQVVERIFVYRRTYRFCNLHKLSCTTSYRRWPLGRCDRRYCWRRGRRSGTSRPCGILLLAQTEKQHGQNQPACASRRPIPGLRLPTTLSTTASLQPSSSLFAATGYGRGTFAAVATACRKIRAPRRHSSSRSTDQPRPCRDGFRVLSSACGCETNPLDETDTMYRKLEVGNLRTNSCIYSEPGSVFVDIPSFSNVIMIFRKRSDRVKSCYVTFDNISAFAHILSLVSHSAKQRLHSIKK